MISTEHRVAVVAGSAGVVARFDSDVVAIGGRTAAVARVMASLTPEGGPLDAAQRVDVLRSAENVDVAAVVRSGGSFEVVTTGNGLVATPDGQPVEPTSLVVWVGVGPVPSEASSRLDAAQHLDLRSGCVPGQGVLVAAPAATSDAEPTFEVADLAAPADTNPRAPLPIAESAEAAGAAAPAPPAAPPDEPPATLGSTTEVMGIRCSREHFNNPRAAYCQVCGISMVHVTHYLVPGPRPTLGFLVFDDGATFALDRSYCVGREPASDPLRDLAPLVLSDERHSVSRSHAELLLDGWDLVIHDLGSTNGTFVWSNELQMWNRVVPGRPATVEPGTSVAIGRKVFVYESVARSI